MTIYLLMNTKIMVFSDNSIISLGTASIVAVLKNVGIFIVRE